MKIATHDGPFHTDDLLATALLTLLHPQAERIRTRDQNELDSCDIVYDVGGVYDPEKGRFDHHMANFNEKHDNGLVLSSFGLLWRKYGLEYCAGNQEVAGKMYDSFVAAIDGPDNGQSLYELTQYEVSPVTLNDVFKSFYPAYGEDGSFDEAFEHALPLAKTVIERMKAKYEGRVMARDKFRAAYHSADDKQYVVLDESMPFGEEAQDLPELLYVAFPADNNGYIIRAVAKEKDSFEVRKPFPNAWAGLNDAELQKASGVADAVFCHKGLWLARTLSRRGAVSLIENALKQ